MEASDESPGHGPAVIAVGELLVEIMRAKVGVPHDVPGFYRGPYPSGAPAIFIDAVGRLGRPAGITAGFVGVVGQDAFGRLIRAKLDRDGVDTRQVHEDPTRTTGVAFVQYDPDGSRQFIFAQGAAGQTAPAMINREYFAAIRALHVTGSALAISPSSRDACYAAIRLVREINPDVLVSFDPNLRPEMMPAVELAATCQPVLGEADVVLPSGAEATLVTGKGTAVDACEHLLAGKARVVVLKRGKAGCRIYTRDDTPPLDVAGFRVEEVDPTGAGDTFGGAFLVGLLQDWALDRAATFANAAGALKVTCFGPMPDSTLDDVLALVDQQRPGSA